MDTEREQGRFEGDVLRGLEDLKESVGEIKEDFRLYRLETNKSIKKNSLDIARQRGWAAAIAMVAGIAGGFIRSFWGK